MDTETTGDERGHDPDFYIEDGNIVLSAKDSKNHTTYFRLHRSTLMKHSPVFADMFSMPPPPTTDQYDDVPLAEMPDDADALRDFIALLYEPQSISALLDVDDFALKMLKPTQLAKKYQVDWICKMVASQLQKQWPTTVGGWDRIAEDEGDEVMRAEFGDWTPEWEDATLRLRQLPEPVSAILLARECDVPAILPFAFLHLLRFPLEPEDDYYPTTAWTEPARALLSQDDVHRLSVARERIGKWFLHQPAYEITKDCGSGMLCHLITGQTWFNIARDVAVDGNFFRASQGVQRTGRNICPQCKTKLEAEVRKLRLSFAEKLSIFFQL
ncbi:hypothetical protein C8R44DRAFT_847195 [Mycena epipterygia]|nr:hypothetical protein C8R44DRAFT_847195 [Mycena epipterygia]